MDVSAAYDEHRVLNSVCLEVENGERIGIVGRNGAGKTTLFFVIMGLVRSLSGRISVCGFQTDNKKDLRELRKTVGIVFQKADDQLFSGTVFEDVAFGPLNQGMGDEAIRRRVLKVLEDVGMADRADRIGHHLSAGEKRRVAIATALAMDPRLLILDEPTSELDPEGRRGIIKLLNFFDKTQLIASHDLEFVLETCSRVVVMDKGVIVASGNTATILANPDLMNRYGLEVPYSLRYPNR